MEKLGAVNCYSHGKHHVYTINLAYGTTPFITFFDNLEHHSCFYRIDSTTVEVTHGWYRPLLTEFGTLDKWTQDHVLNGGLLLAKLTEAVSRQSAIPLVWDDNYEKFQEWCLSYYGRRLPSLKDRVDFC